LNFTIPCKNWYLDSGCIDERLQYMVYSEKKKQKQKKQLTSSISDSIRILWSQKRPVLFFVLGFTFLMVVFFVFINSVFFTTHINPQILSANAWVSSKILNLFVLHTMVSGETIYSKAYSITVARGCDAVEGIALFSAALLTFPAKWKSKLIGLLTGTIFLLLLNLVRIISLFLTGLYFPKAFPLMHEDIWQGLFIFCVIGVMIFWIRWAGKGNDHVAV
jgi:exosortase/archaeosortase family protein